jgi:hypothetical protein
MKKEEGPPAPCPHACQVASGTAVLGLTPWRCTVCGFVKWPGRDWEPPPVSPAPGDALGECVGHLGPPSNTGTPHPRGSTCSHWKPLCPQCRHEHPGKGCTVRTFDEPHGICGCVYGAPGSAQAITSPAPPVSPPAPEEGTAEHDRALYAADLASLRSRLAEAERRAEKAEAEFRASLDNGGRVFMGGIGHAKRAEKAEHALRAATACLTTVERARKREHRILRALLRKMRWTVFPPTLTQAAEWIEFALLIGERKRKKP